MPFLILRDTHGRELARRPMLAQERYAVYRCCAEHELLTLAGVRYRVERVAWCVPEEECRCLVQVDGYEPTVHAECD